MLRYMLDTNVSIYLMREPDISRFRAKFSRMSGQICISTVTFMELSYGAEYGESMRNHKALSDFVSVTTMLDYDRDAAAHTGDIRAQLRRAGKPIGPYDAMIAGHARSKALALVTNNIAEFARLPGLQCESWIS